MRTKRKIDETDAKILKALLYESRTSFTKIAKNCKITVAAVRKRYNRLWKIGIINGEIMQVNPRSLGYRCACDIGITIQIDGEKNVIDFLNNKPYVAFVMGAWGKYDIGAFLTLPDTQQLAKVFEELEANPNIKHTDALIWVDPIGMDHPENLKLKGLKEKNEKKPIIIGKEQTSMDKTDRQIAKILSQNSRTHFNEIAQQLNISTKTVIKRYKRLRGSVLTLSTITVNLEKLGYNAIAHLFIKVANKSKMPEIYEQMLQISNLIVGIRTIGPYDLHAMVALTDFKELFSLKKEIRRIPNIEKSETYIIAPSNKWPANVFSRLL